MRRCGSYGGPWQITGLAAAMGVGRPVILPAPYDKMESSRCERRPESGHMARVWRSETAAMRASLTGDPM
ncbi:unnamed protein product [Staurois parvus]|uniref:Uncharacterized protein n=1 Tax=Staurois parvus TaxID=386267 RepID=A0ABN9CZN2_9NEOB|nr:unnamed protein product [Staurois parvus]